jgi:hypothetical protein
MTSLMAACDGLQVTHDAALALATRWQIMYVEASAAPTSVAVIQENVALDDAVLIQVILRELAGCFLFALCI